MSAFGKALLSEFLVDPEIRQLNNGSHGSVPRRVVDFQRELQDSIYRWPDLYYTKKNELLWKKSLEIVAEFLGAKPENLTFVENATFGTQVHWLPLKNSDRIETKVIDLFEEYLNRYPNIKVVLTDHITRFTACLLPIEEIINLCHRHGKIIVVDGAHAPGQVALNLENLRADFYIGTFYKWLFSPVTYGFLYVHPKHHGTVHCPISSEGYSSGSGQNFQMEFLKLGTKDNTACASSVEGIRFLKDLGGLETTSAYIADLLDSAVELLTEAWGTHKFPIPRDMETPFLRLKDDIGLRSVRNILRERFKVEVIVRWIDGNAYVRISGQVFNSINDYKALADAVLTLKSEGED